MADDLDGKVEVEAPDLFVLQDAAETRSVDEAAAPGSALKNLAVYRHVAVIASTDEARWSARHSLPSGSPAEDADADVVIHAARVPLAGALCRR